MAITDEDRALVAAVQSGASLPFGAVGLLEWLLRKGSPGEADRALIGAALSAAAGRRTQQGGH